MPEIRKQRRPRSREWWMRHIENWEASGVTMVEYAKQNNLDIRSLYHWKAKLRSEVNGRSRAKVKGAGRDLGDVQFVEVSVGQEKARPIELIAPNGWSIRFSSDTESSTIEKFVSILEELS